MTFLLVLAADPRQTSVAEQIVFRMPEPETDSGERNKKAARRVTREESRFQSGQFLRCYGSVNTRESLRSRTAASSSEIYM